MADHALTLIGTDRNDEAVEIVRCLTAFTEANLDSCLRAFVSHGSFWPWYPFHRSPPDVRDDLLARIDCDAENRHPILAALAWIGDATVVKQFDSWRRMPPPWNKSFDFPIHHYPHEAGWELTRDGQRRDLCFRQCVQLQKKGPSHTPASFLSLVERADFCPCCQSSLTTLFDFDPTSFGISHDHGTFGPVQIVTCEICTTFETVMGFVDQDGRGWWGPKNVCPHLPDHWTSFERLPNDALTPGKVRPAIFGVDWCLPTTFSQLGGYPAWLQNAEYPGCPMCSKTMMFLAQLACDEIEEYSEGFYYAFICPDCRTTATSYQST